MYIDFGGSIKHTTLKSPTVHRLLLISHLIDNVFIKKNAALFDELYQSTSMGWVVVWFLPKIQATPLILDNIASHPIVFCFSPQTVIHATAFTPNLMS